MLEKGKLLGKYCVELLLDTVGPGSVLGYMTTLMDYNYNIQAKAQMECKILTVDRAVLVQLRKEDLGYNKVIKEAENW